MTDEEIVDLYDADGHVVGSAPRSQVRAQNLRHAGTAIIVRDSAGRIFVHRRTTTKDVYPGLYDYCAGGVVMAGEVPAEAAAREVAEELGVQGVPLTPFGQGSYHDEHTSYLAFFYETVWDGAVTLQADEVEWGAWLTVEELLARLDGAPGPDGTQWRFVPDTSTLARDYLDNALAQLGAASTEPGDPTRR